MPVLEIENLTRRYGKQIAVNGLCLEMEAGDILGFVGSNGAGKTTTIRMIATLLEPTAGTVRVAGYDIHEHPTEVRKRVGYMPDFFGVYDDLEVWEYLDFFARAFRLPPNLRQSAINDVLEITDLMNKRSAMVMSLSRGMKQRLCLAKTLLHNPDILLLDEPASGLDPRARVEQKEIFRDLQSMGKSILVSSHILPELADFCNKVAVLEMGHLVAYGPVDALMDSMKISQSFRIVIAGDVEKARALLETMEDVQIQLVSDKTIHINYTGEKDQEHVVISRLVSDGLGVSSFQPVNMDLEDVFLRVTSGRSS